MRPFAIIIFLCSTFGLTAQTNTHLPLKSFSYEYLSVNKRDSIDAPYLEYAIFSGDGEIHIYNDSINFKWMNEWECGVYRLIIDSAVYEEMDYDGYSEWLSIYTVKSKGYHDVDGTLILSEGTDIERGRYTHILFDTKMTAEGWPTNRRIYTSIEELK